MGLDVEVRVQEENISKQKVEIGRCRNLSQSHSRVIVQVAFHRGKWGQSGEGPHVLLLQVLLQQQ